MENFKRINETNKLTLNKPLNSDMIYYSELNEWFTSNAFRSFSLKFVVDEHIYYKVDNREYRVRANHFMLASKQSDVKAYFSSLKPVKSICIDICPQSIADVYTTLTARHDDLDTCLPAYFRYPNFYESINPALGSILGHKLRCLLSHIEQNHDFSVSKEWFLDLTEKIIYKEYGNFLALKNLHSIKTTTKKEIFKRLHVGREYMDNHFLTIREIKEVAAVSSMSEYHFFRSFKQAFGITPYQYITKKKMECACELLQDKHKTLSEIALLCNFPDVFTFSKAFKRYYGVPPSQKR